MTDLTFQQKTTLGRTGLSVSRIGLAGGYKVPAKAVERAFHEYGINFFYWETRKTGPRSEEEMDQGLQALNQGPLTPEELDRIRRIGDHVHG